MVSSFSILILKHAIDAHSCFINLGHRVILINSVRPARPPTSARSGHHASQTYSSKTESKRHYTKDKRWLQYRNMQDTISETLIESLFDSIVNAAEKEGVQSHELFALLHDRFHPTQRQEMPRKKRLKTKHDGTLPEHKWWNMFPSELTNSVLDCLPRCALADFSQCSKELNKVVEDYAKAHLEKTDLGKSLIKRHMDGTSRERENLFSGLFAPLYGRGTKDWVLL